MFLPWHASASDGAAESVPGVSVTEGQLVLVVSLITAGLVQVGWRPAWIGAGFVASLAIRKILDGDTDPASGLWIALAASIVAAVLLIWDMFANVAAPGDQSGPNHRGLSGPLGRRRH